MSKFDFNRARSETISFLDTRGIADHMLHGPTSDKYWDEPLRLVAVNMESYGYDGRHEVNHATLIDWLYDAGNTGTKTTRRTLAILSLLRRRLLTSKPANWGDFQATCADDKELEIELGRCVYYNIRPESNKVVQQNASAISAVGSSEIGSLIWNELLALDPHVMLISGHAGLAALNGLAHLDTPLKYKGNTVHTQGFVIQSFGHPAYPRYNDWAAMIEDVAQIKQGGKNDGCIAERPITIQGPNDLSPSLISPSSHTS